MSRLLPLTIAEMLEDELAVVHTTQRVQHSWALENGDVDDAKVRDRLTIMLDPELSPPDEAYEWIDARLKKRKLPFWRVFSALTRRRLLPKVTLSVRMVTPFLGEMYYQVSVADTDARIDDIQRVNRLILEALFPEAIASAEDRHLRATVLRLHKVKASALCLSGGGIRSATFALGVLQGLARAGNATAKPSGQYAIDELDYLSTVSGGGFIGAWLSKWISKEGKEEVFRYLRSMPDQLLSPEPAPVRWLREYSNYLAPRFSLVSTDTWTLIATWLRNVIINWFVFLPFLGALLLVPRLLASVFAHSAGFQLLSFSAGLVLTVTAVVLISAFRPAAYTNPSRGRLQAIRFALGSAFLAAIAFSLFWSAVHDNNIGLAWFVSLGVVVQLTGASRDLVARDKGWRWRVATFVYLVVSGLGGGLTLWSMTLIPSLRPPIHSFAMFSLFAPLAFIGSFLMASAILTVLTSRDGSDEFREYWARLGAALLLICVVYATISTISFYGPVLLTLAPKVVTAIGSISGIIGILLGASERSPADRERRRTVSDRLTAVAIPIFVIVLLSAISLGVSELLKYPWKESPNLYVKPPSAKIEITAKINGESLHVVSSAKDRSAGLPEAALEHLTVVEHTAPGIIFEFILGAAMFSFIASLFVDVNKFSMHGLYRMRLVRAYMGASNRWRNPDLFTGFDPFDGVLLSELAQQKPFHVVNMALNLVRGKRLAWQQRKASTFTSTPLHCGNWSLGYRQTVDYGGRVAGLDLGTAITISGAAASPNMGYHSSPLLSFLLAIFNVRLGAWLGNPGPAGAARSWDDRFGKSPAWQRSSPKSSLAHALAEALGWTDDDHQYVYLSDGGHFENLGLYEAVLRRCQHVIVSDAGCDDAFELEDLGNAVRKIRVDFGIPIEFERFALVSRQEKRRGAHCAIGRIRYSAVDGTRRRKDGYLLYIKATYYAAGPRDVQQYAIKSRRFPHETTGDQFFNEAQFESYRRLGQWVIEQIVADGRPTTLRQLFAAAQSYSRKYKDAPQW